MVRITGTAVLGLSLAWIALAGEPSDNVPPAQIERLVTQEIKFIQESLAKGKTDRKTTGRVKMTALMIAHYAQSAMTKENAKEMATLRDQALAIIKAMNDEPAGAKKLADALLPKPKADPAAKTDKIALNTHLEVGLFMRIFSSKLIGGFGLEKDLDDLAERKDKLTAEEQQKVADMAYKLVMMASLAHGSYTPEQDEGGQKTRKNWQTYAISFRSSALGLAEAAKTNNNVGVAANAVMVTCTKCHDVFRKQ